MNRLEIGDNRIVLKKFKDAGFSCQCIITSPPYWREKDYGHPSQIGQEETLEEYLEHLIEVFMLCWPLLTNNGVMWINIDDCRNGTGGSGGDYSSGGRRFGQPKSPGRKVPWLKPKELCGIPWRLAFALQERGWRWRDDVCWHKTNGGQESVRDRFPRSHEPVLMFTKSHSYYFDQDSTRQLAKTQEKRIKRHVYQGKSTTTSTFRPPHPDGPAMRSVWITPVSNYHDAHYAVMADEVAEITILSSSRPGDMVLDPFGGAGTTALVAERLGRFWTLIELGPQYESLIRARTAQPNMFLAMENR